MPLFWNSFNEAHDLLDLGKVSIFSQRNENMFLQRKLLNMFQPKRDSVRPVNRQFHFIGIPLR